jgi:tRNA pseudouridine13 synthase
MLPTALFKQTPEDFVVDEIDAYPALGEGPHVLVRIRKRSLNTEQAVARIADALGANRRDCGFAGMKDRDAITTQRISIPNVDPERARALKWDDLEVLEASLHRNKLKPGHLRGNRFRIRLRQVSDVDAVIAGLDRIRVEGFPNAFGPQRFGRDGDNADRALAFVRGDGKPPRDPRERRLLFSALQSRWFNAVLSARVADGTWNTALLGDLLKKTESGGMFLCEDPDTDRERALRGEVSATGPMFGPEMTLPGDGVRERELAVLAADGLDLDALTRHRALGEGTRRPLRVLTEDLVYERLPEADGLIVTMTLGKGVYATTALANVVTLEQPRPAVPLATGQARGHQDTPQDRVEDPNGAE